MGNFIAANVSYDDNENTTASNATLSAILSLYQSISAQRVVPYEGDPFGNIIVPVYGSNPPRETTPTVALIMALVHWRQYFDNIISSLSSLSYTEDGIIVILSNGCQESYSYQLNGHAVQYLGSGDQHNSHYEQYERNASFTDGLTTMVRVDIPNIDTTYCPIRIQMYPSDDYYNNQLKSNVPTMLMSMVLGSFLLLGILFALYEKNVAARHRVVMARAVQSSKLVSSLFPGEIADRVLEQQTSSKNNVSTTNYSGSTNVINNLPESVIQVDDKVGNNNSNVTADSDNKIDTDSKLLGTSKHIRRSKSISISTHRKTLQSLASEHVRRETTHDGTTTDDDDNSSDHAAPIADLFPNTTVLFADIAGFTAWSSTREPTQVFTLLQGVYRAFDKIAKRRKVFKVETIGDSYVAVTGLPRPQENHAVIMARFAVECQLKMAEVTNKLELQLGPGTSGTIILFFGIRLMQPYLNVHSMESQWTGIFFIHFIFFVQQIWLCEPDCTVDQ
jgi:hypothetical protein